MTRLLVATKLVGHAQAIPSSDWHAHLESWQAHGSRSLLNELAAIRVRKRRAEVLADSLFDAWRSLVR